jgi:DNA repair ATPase RecN
LHRIDLATQEITTMERGDLHPNKINKLPSDEKELAEWIAEQAREARHTLDRISTEKNYLDAIDELTELSEKITKKYYTMMENMSPEFTQKSIENVCNGLPEEKRLKCVQTMNQVMNN